jgi:hypothetical protein
MAGVGVERISAADVEIPRILLLQALSPQVQDGGERAGRFYHSVAEVALGDKLDIIIVYADQSFILWRPRESGGGILARAADGIHWSPPDATFEVKIKGIKESIKWRTAPTVAKSGLAEWGSSNPDDPGSPPAATRMYNLVCVMPEHPELSPAVVTLQRSAIKVARKLMGKLKIAQAPVFGLKFTMDSVKDQNSQNQEFWNYRFTANGFVEDEKTFNACKEMYERFKAQGVKIRDIEGLQDDQMADDGGARDEAAGKKHEGKF